MFGSWQNDGTALWWLWCAVCLLFLVSPVVPGLMVSAPWLVPAVRCLHSPSSYPPLLSSSALPTSLFLSHSFFYSLCSRLSWRGKTFPQLSQSPQPPPHPPPFLSNPLFLITRSLSSPHSSSSSLSFTFLSFSVPPSSLRLPLFPPFYFCLFSFYSSSSVSLSPPFPGTNWHHMMPIPTCAQTQPHSHTQTPTCMCIYHRVADVFHSAL